MSNRKELIKELVEQSRKASDAKLGFSMVEVRGSVEKLISYRLPISELRYNIRNGRFKAELIEKEHELRRTLNPDNKQDAEIIKELLLAQEAEKTVMLKKNIESHGQISPGLITEDGYVIDGNKRMAIIDTLKEETSDARWDFMEVMVLPPTVSEQDLWRIEAGISLSDEKRIAYGPINELLKIREGKIAGLSDKEMAKSIYGLKPKDIKERLEWLNLAEEYLSYIGRQGHIKEIERHFEHIKSLSSTRNRLIKDGKIGDELTEFITISFEAIRAGATNSEVRKIGEAKKKKYKRAYSYLRKAKEKKNLDKEAVEDAVDLIKSEKDTEKPQKLLSKVIELLQMIHDIDREQLANRVDKRDLVRAKELIGEIMYTYNKAGGDTKRKIDQLVDKYNKE